MSNLWHYWLSLFCCFLNVIWLFILRLLQATRIFSLGLLISGINYMLWLKILPKTVFRFQKRSSLNVVKVMPDTCVVLHTSVLQNMCTCLYRVVKYFKCMFLITNESEHLFICRSVYFLLKNAHSNPLLIFLMAIVDFQKLKNPSWY